VYFNLWKKVRFAGNKRGAEKIRWNQNARATPDGKKRKKARGLQWENGRGQSRKGQLYLREDLSNRIRIEEALRCKNNIIPVHRSRKGKNEEGLLGQRTKKTGPKNHTGKVK